jgi:enoyl-CoA hydratase
MEKISLRFEDDIAIIKIDDGKANTMTPTFFRELNEALDQTEASNAKMLIFEGRKGFFSGGLDLKVMGSLTGNELIDLVETFAESLLRVYVYRIPTMAACTGHAIAGGAMLAFACDRRFAVNGPYRFQVNEVQIGIALPYWMLLLGQSAVPSRFLVETLLHGRAYPLSEAFEKGIFDSMVSEDTDIILYIKESTKNIMNLNLSAYALSKKRMRESNVQRVLKLLKDELGKKAT